MNYLVLITSLGIAGVAGWYSIVGLMAIFSGAAIPIAIMGGSLEIGKLVTASWLHQNWKNTSIALKSYLTLAVVVLMLITSLGIFGFLSKAHLEQSISTGGTNELQIENLERQIDNERRIIRDSETVIQQLDQTVQTLMDYDRIRGKDGALQVRKDQTEERQTLNQTINTSFSRIEELESTLLPLKKQQLEIEVEVGPLKYIAELIYGDEAKDMFDEAVRFVILLIIFVFDPLAIAMLLAANQGFREKRVSKMFYDDGNMRVDPNNVVDVEEIIPKQEPTWDDFFEDDIPTDDDISDYDVMEEDPDWDHPPIEEPEPDLTRVGKMKDKKYNHGYKSRRKKKDPTDPVRRG